MLYDSGSKIQVRELQWSVHNCKYLVTTLINFVLHTSQGPLCKQYFLYNFKVIYSLATKFSEIIWKVINIVFVQNRLLSLGIKLTIRFLSVNRGRSGRGQILK